MKIRPALLLKMSKSIFSYFMKSSEQNRNVSTTRQVPALTAMTGITEEEVSIIVDEIEEASDIRKESVLHTKKPIRFVLLDTPICTHLVEL